MIQPLMPKATAVWLVENTALTFDQIADFCGLHVLEVKGIADGDVATGIKGMDPIVSGQLSRNEIERCQGNPATRLMRAESKYKVPPAQPRKGPRYTPVSRRQDRPDAIAWLLRNHPELTHAQIAKLVGTTKPTIESIDNRTHWNSANIKPVDPVTLGLATQIELDAAVQKAGRKLERERKKAAKAAGGTDTLLSAAETTAPAEQHATIAAPETKPEEDESRKSYDADSVFASLKNVKIEEDDED